MRKHVEWVFDDLLLEKDRELRSVDDAQIAKRSVVVVDGLILQIDPERAGWALQARQVADAVPQAAKGLARERLHSGHRDIDAHRPKMLQPRHGKINDDR